LKILIHSTFPTVQLGNMVFDNSSKIPIHSTFPAVQLDKFIILTHFTSHTITGTSK